MKRVVSLILFSVFLLSNNVHAVFNVITDGDPILASPIMQNFRHVNYGNVLKPVDTNGNPLSNVLDLGTNTAYWRDLYLSGTANIGHGLVVGDSTFFVDYINNKVGISTANPSVALEVVGALTQSSGNTILVEDGTSKLFIKAAYGNSTGLQIYNNRYTDVASIINGYNSDIAFGTNGAENMRLKAGGNLGIGATNPVSLLELRQSYSATWNPTQSGSFDSGPYPGELTIKNSVNNTTGSFASVFFSAGQTSAGLQVNAARITAIREAAIDTALAFTTRSNALGTREKLRITSSGLVGVGTTNPIAALQIARNYNGNAQLVISNAATTKSFGISLDEDLDKIYLDGGSSRPIILNSINGNVGIGLAAVTPSALLDVGGTANVQTDLIVSNRFSAPNKEGVSAYFGGGSLNVPNTTVTTLNFNAEHYDYGAIYSNGRFTIKSTGRYLFCAQIEWMNDSASGVRIATLYKNGSYYRTLDYRLVTATLGSTNCILVGSVIFEATAGDVFVVKLNQNSGVTVSVSVLTTYAQIDRLN